ncbi:MAG: thiamine-phosphate pyrophosphorylase [Candidatus Omnitrophota bacterium]
MQRVTHQKVYRVIDANLNRAKEGLRVCEDITRFALNHARWTKTYKQIRHQLSFSLFDSLKNQEQLFQARDISGDQGCRSTRTELQRDGIRDIFLANSQRVKESIRVLEEFSKMICPKKTAIFKKSRYKVYDLEKKIIEKL